MNFIYISSRYDNILNTYNFNVYKCIDYVGVVTFNETQFFIIDVNHRDHFCYTNVFAAICEQVCLSITLILHLQVLTMNFINNSKITAWNEKIRKKEFFWMSNKTLEERIDKIKKTDYSFNQKNDLIFCQLNMISDEIKKYTKKWIQTINLFCNHVNRIVNSIIQQFILKNMKYVSINGRMKTYFEEKKYYFENL